MKTIRYFIAAVAAMSLLVSCDNKAEIDLFDSPLVADGSGTLAAIGQSVSTLAFSWNAVEGSYQYGYKLANADGVAVRQGIVKATKIAFDNLDPDTQYTLVVEAYGMNGYPTRVFSITARTDKVLQLSAPDPSKMEVAFESGNAVISWQAVENAEYYDYTLMSADGESLYDGTVETTQVMFRSLPEDDYVLLLTADSDNPAFSRSETVEFTFYQPGDMPNYSDVAYSYEYYDPSIVIDKAVPVDVYDGYFVLHGWLGSDSQDLKVVFDPETDEVLAITPINNGVEGTTYTPTGYASFNTPGTDFTAVQIYIATDYCYAYADEEGGYLMIGAYFYTSSTDYEWAYYYLAWGETEDEEEE